MIKYLKKYKKAIEKARSAAEDISPIDYCSKELIRRTYLEVEKYFLDNNMKEMSDEEERKRREESI